MSIFDTSEATVRTDDTEIQFERAEREDEISSLLLQARAHKLGGEVRASADIEGIKPLPRCPICHEKRIWNLSRCKKCGHRFAV